MLWLWCWLAAAALIQPLAWECPYAASAALKKAKKKKEEGKKERKKEMKEVWLQNVVAYYVYVLAFLILCNTPLPVLYKE